MAVTQKANKRKPAKLSTAKAKASKRTVRFDSDNSDHWHTIPSKGQLFALAVAAFNGAKINGAAFGSREVAKAEIAAAKESGLLD